MVTWSTDAETESMVHYDDGKTKQTATGSSSKFVYGDRNDRIMWIHRVTLKDLKFDQSYSTFRGHIIQYSSSSGRKENWTAMPGVTGLIPVSRLTFMYEYLCSVFASSMCMWTCSQSNNFEGSINCLELTFSDYRLCLVLNQMMLCYNIQTQEK